MIGVVNIPLATNEQTPASTAPFVCYSKLPNRVRRKKFELFAPHCLDSYKLGHRLQYVKGTEYILSNFTARSLKYLYDMFPTLARYNDNKIVWVGLSGVLKDFVAIWDESFFQRPKEEVLAQYVERVKDFSSDDEAPGVEHLAALHDLGYLPIRVKSIAEGSRVNYGIPLFTIVNTLPGFYWLTNSLETFLSNENWKAPTVATLAYLFRKILTDAAELTGSPMDYVMWQGHCFADRGMSGMLDAAKTCAWHQSSFLGTDSVSGLDWLDYYYRGKETYKGGSVNATEHSVMTLEGPGMELNTVARIISEVHTCGIVSFVADSFDFWALLEWLATQRHLIESRTFNSIGLSKVVVRPDSGDPVEILCGLELEDYTDHGAVERASSTAAGRLVRKEVHASNGDQGADVVTGKFTYKGETYQVTAELSWEEVNDEIFYVRDWKVTACELAPLTTAEKGAVQFLYEAFEGGTVTDKGFKVMWNRVGLIYGDSITPERASEIMRRLIKKGYASCNVVLGIGSYTYQYLTRDTMGIAIKATAGVVNSETYAIEKNPKTDSGVKKSAKGLPCVVIDEKGDYILLQNQTWEQEAQGELKPVFEDGNFFVDPALADMREKLWPTAATA